MLDYNQIKEIIKEIDSSSLRVFELECQDIKLKLSKNKENSIYKDNKDYSKEEKISSYLNKEISLEKEVAKEVTDEVKDYLVTTCGSLDSWLDAKIEATINILKNILNLDGGEGVSDIIN